LVFVYDGHTISRPTDLTFSVLIAEEGWFDGNYSASNSAVPERSTKVPAVLAWRMGDQVQRAARTRQNA
jgi:hypothetical protein